MLDAYRVFACFARCFAETMEFYGPRPRRFRIDEPERNHVADALERGRGVILATAHVGNWDISGRALHATGRPVHLVMGREPNETTQEYARRSREQAGVRVIYTDSSVFSAFNMIRALRRNEILAIQIDRSNGGSDSARPIEFFGGRAPFQEGPFHLARLSGAPVVPVVTLRRGLRHYEILLGEPRWVSREVPEPTPSARSARPWHSWRPRSASIRSSGSSSRRSGCRRDEDLPGLAEPLRSRRLAPQDDALLDERHDAAVPEAADATRRMT